MQTYLQILEDLTLLMPAGNEDLSFSQNIFCEAHNFAETRNTSVSVVVHFKPEIELIQELKKI